MICMLLFFIHWAIFCITSDQIGLWDGLTAPSWGMTMDQTGMSSSEGKFICASKSLIFFICFVIWINFHHKPGRVGRQPTELQFFSFIAGWEREEGQWFQHASVGYLMIPFHWKAIYILHTLFSLVAKIQELYPEADGNYMGFKRKGLDEKMSWDCSYYYRNTSVWLNYIHAWIPTVAPMIELLDSHSRSDAEIAKKWIPTAGRMKELMDSHSSSDDRIGGFPQ